MTPARTTLTLVLVLAATGCANTMSREGMPTASPAPATSEPRGPTRAPASVAAIPGLIINGGNQLTKRSVYFDFDSNAVRDEYAPTVRAHARYLIERKRDATVRIEGHTDERGSREYNLALGQRRAEAVRKVMTVFGVEAGRVETVSFGEEKPKAQGHDEASWAENRRADIRYPGEY